MVRQACQGLCLIFMPRGCALGTTDGGGPYAGRGRRRLCPQKTKK
nr:MAG TPA: hypothetical protein [Caudoviricetes sp.]